MSGYPKVSPEVIAALAKENRSPEVITIVAAATALGLVCVVLRFYSRVKYVGFVGMEDYFIALSMIFSGFTSACLIQGARYGNGKHLLNVPMENTLQLLRYLFFGILAYHASLTLTKISILLQYWRIFTFKGSRMPIYIAMAICIACGITSIVTATVTCIPVDAYWNLAKRPFAKCLNQDAMYHANAGLNIATDLLVAALPLRPLWKLQIAMRQKIAVVLILTLGWFVVIISVLRLYFLVLVAEHPEDQTWYSGPVAYWSTLEVNLAIVCASMPALKPLIAHIVPTIFATRFGGTKRTNDNSTVHPRTIGSHSLQNNGHFLRLKPSQSSMHDQILLEHGVTAPAHSQSNSLGHPRTGDWKEIHVTRSFEQQSMNADRLSDDSRKGLESGFPKTRPMGPL